MGGLLYKVNLSLTKKIPYLQEKELSYILLLAAVQFAHMVDFVVLMPLGPTLMRDLQISPIQFGSLVSSYNFSAAIAGLCFGAIADKFDRKSLLMMALTGFLIGTTLCGVTDKFALLVTFRIFTGAFGGMMNGIIFAAITDLVPYQRRGKALGIVMSSFSVASVVGVPIGLAISDTFGWSFTFYFIAAFTTVIWVLAQFIFPNLTGHLGRPHTSFVKRLKKLISNSEYVLSFIFIFFVSGSMFLLIPFLSPYAVKNMGIATTQLKYMYLVGGLFTVVTARMIGVMTDKLGALKLFVTIVFVSFIPTMLYTHAGRINFLTYLALGSFFMTMVSGRMIPCMTLISEVPAEDERGLFMSVLHSIRASGSASMTFLAGFFISETSQGQLLGFNHTGYLSILLGAGTTILAYRIWQKVEQRSQCRIGPQ